MEKQSKVIKAILSILMLVGCGGCASVQMAPPELDQLAKSFSPPADKSYIYVMRQSSFAAGGAYMAVVLKEWEEKKRMREKAVAYLKNGTYVLFEVPPSDYEVLIGLASNKEDWRMEIQYWNRERIKLVALPGHMYFIASQFSSPIGPEYRFYAELLPKEDGKEAILDYDRVISSSLDKTASPKR